MIRTPVLSFVLLAAACGTAACGAGGLATELPDGDGSTGTGDDGAAPPADGGDAGGDGGDPEPSAPPLPNACDASKPCPGALQCRSGVCTPDPPAGAESFVTDLENKPTSERPDLSCADVEPGPTEGPAAATLFGAVTRFGAGLVTDGIQVEAYLADAWDPSACEAEGDVDDRIDCYAAYGDPIATTVSVPAGDIPHQVCDYLSEVDPCPLGYECIEETSVNGACERQFGLYVLEGIPTDTRLVLRSTPGPDLSDLQKKKWHPTYHFNVWIYADRVDGEGRYRYDVTMVSDGQWHTTPNSVGLPDVPEEHGVVGGRIRDCRRPGIRDSWPVSEVSVALGRSAAKIVYFNNIEDDTVPLIDRVSTDVLGRYAALDVPAGWNLLAGAARVEGEVVTVGAEEVYVVPNALSIVTWPGLQPVFKQEPAGEFP